VTESPEDVERLRARLRELEEQLAARDAAPVTEVRSRRDRQWWRSIIVVVLIVVAAALAPLTVLATWAHDQIGDTDRFEQTVASKEKEKEEIVRRYAEQKKRYLELRGEATPTKQVERAR